MLKEEEPFNYINNIQDDNDARVTKDAFEVLPNELLHHILSLLFPSAWLVLCKFVCSRWRLLSPLSFPSSAFATVAAEGGHLKVLQWARSQGCPWDGQTCAMAARGGHLEVLQWLRTQGCPWNEWTGKNAACRGHLKMLKWARSQGCPWDETTCDQAARGGHLEVLQWVRSQGCPWSSMTCKSAAEGGHLGSCNGPEAKAVPGMRGHAHMQLVEATGKF